MKRDKRLRFILFMIIISVFIDFQCVAQEATTEHVVNVLILDFSSDKKKDNYYLKTDVTWVVHLSLTFYEDVRIIVNEEYARLENREIRRIYQQGNLPDVDLVISGDYETVGDDIRIYPYILNLDDGRIHRVDFIRGATRNLAKMIDEIGSKLYLKINEINPVRKRTKKIAISCSYNDAGLSAKSSKKIYSNTLELSRLINNKIQHPENVELTPWRTVKSFCNKPYGEIMETLGIDGLINLNFLFSDKSKLISITPVFYRTGSPPGEALLELPELHTQYYEDFGIVDFTANELNGFLNTVITANGAWYIDVYKNIFSDPGIMLFKADSLSGKTLYPISNFYYYKVLQDPKNTYKVTDIRRRLGYNKINENRLGEAAEEFNYVISQDQDDEAAYLGQAWVSYYQSDFENALFWVEISKERGNKYVFDASRIEGLAYFDMENYKKSLDAFLIAKEVSPDDLNTLINVGLCYLRLGQYDKAITEFTKLFNEYNGLNQTDYYLGYALSENGIDEYFKENYPLAIDLFLQSREYYSFDYIIDYLRMAMIKDKRFEQASALIEEQIFNGMFDPKTIYYNHALDVRTEFINSQFNQEIGTEVIRLLNTNLEYNINDASSYYYIGNTHTLLGDPIKGLENFERAFSSDKHNLSIQLDLMEAYLLNNRFTDCEILYQELNEVNEGYDVPDRHETLLDYMLLTALKVQHKNTDEVEIRMNLHFKKKVTVDFWIYDPYLNWLESCDCSAETKKYLYEITKKMKTLGP